MRVVIVTFTKYHFSVAAEVWATDLVLMEEERNEMFGQNSLRGKTSVS
jgi:hypothetical protein